MAPVLAALLLVGCGPKEDAGDSAAPEGASLTAVTFNSGTTEGMTHDAEPDDGYTGAHAVTSDTHYGDGLAWIPAVDATAQWFAELKPDIVVFQEIFHSEDCAIIPPDQHADFVCERWQAGDPVVAQEVLGPDYEVRCHPGKNDKCIAVRSAFGSLGELDGFDVEGCGSGARVARGLIERTDGSELTVVNYHGSSGLTPEDQDCRTRQVDQVFVDLGDGEPGANGSRNLVMGDLNTDPGRWGDIDTSAARWNDFVGDKGDLQFHTEVGPEAEPSYLLANIDHVMSDAFSGDCWTAGISEGHDDVIDAVYFDHKPAVCDLSDEFLSSSAR